MASVTKETRRGRTYYRLTFIDPSGKRKMIRLGKQFTERGRQEIRRMVEQLVSDRVSGSPLDPATIRWICNLPDDLSERLAAAGVIDRVKRTTLGAFIDEFIGSRKAAANTVRNWQNSRQKLTGFFGSARDLRRIGPGDAEHWHGWLLEQDYAEATVSKMVKHAKQFFTSAVRHGYVLENPFRYLRAGGERNDERQHFVTQETIAAVLEACPSAEWRLIVALCRFGGLRCPSEVLRLRWSDIDWARRRFTVTSPKTKRHGKPWRVVPLFPELEPWFREAMELAAEGATFCVEAYRDQRANLRTQMERILKRAGVDPWERLFQNLRASRQTELENRFPSHVVCRWMGNSESVAMRHYLQVTEEHFAAASSAPDLQVARQVAQAPKIEPAKDLGRGLKSPRKICRDLQKEYTECHHEYPRQESEQPAISPGKTPPDSPGGTTGGTPAERLRELLPNLSTKTVRKLLAIALASLSPDHLEVCADEPITSDPPAGGGRR